MKKTVIITVLCLLMFISCDSLLVSPKAYQEEIEDVVRYNIALALVISDTYLKYEKQEESSSWFWEGDYPTYVYEVKWEKFCDSIDNFEEYLNNLWNQTEEERGYQIVLKQVSEAPTNKWRDLASRILKKYNTVGVVISDYRRIETSTDIKLWKFTELNTGLVGTFKIDSKNKWYCDITDSSWEKYFKYLIK